MGGVSYSLHLEGVVNRVPVPATPAIANDDLVLIDIAMNSSVEIDVLANDIDSDGVIVTTTVNISTAARNGAVTINPLTGVITYTPVVAYTGLDFFTYTVNDNDGMISNSATVSITVADSAAGILHPKASLIIDAGIVSNELVEPPLGQGSWFSMEVNPGQAVHTSITGFHHIKLGELQTASSAPLVPNIDQGWIFFGNIGVHQTIFPIAKITDDSAGNVTLGFLGWDISWNGISSIPMSSGQDNGIAALTCYTNLTALSPGDCSSGNQFVLEYRAIAPSGDPSSHGGVNYRLYLEGSIFYLDTAVPVITLNGDNPLTLNLGDIYTELGATATDNIDSSVNVTVTGNVDTNSARTYSLVYTATDVAGNSAVEIRTVNVLAANTTNDDGNGSISFLSIALFIFYILLANKQRMLALPLFFFY